MAHRNDATKRTDTKKANRVSLLSTAAGRRLIGGTVRNLLAEALFPLTALITSAFLTRRLGPHGYGLLALVLTVIIWIESALNSFFSKATIKFVGETDQWNGLAAAIVRGSILIGCAAMIVVWLAAAPISRFLGETELAAYLYVAALDIPIVAAGFAYRGVLLGIANYRGSAIARASRWLARLLLIVLLIEAGFAITGALLGMIGASIVELAICRYYLGPLRIFSHWRESMKIQRYGGLLLLSSICIMAYTSVDLFFLKRLGGTPAQAGIYNAAQNLALLPALFGWTFSSLLLASLSRLLADGQIAKARESASDALRVTLWLLPVAAIVAGTANEIVPLVFGAAFKPAAALLALLIFGAVANTLLIMALTIMTAHGRPARTVVFAGPLVPLACAGHLLLIPHWGQRGAAWVTVLVALTGAIAAITSTHRLWQVAPPLGSMIRSLVVTLIVGSGAVFWPVAGVLGFAKMIVLAVVALAAYWCLGEFRPSEISIVRSRWLRQKQEVS